MAGGSAAAGWGAALQSLGGNALSYLMRLDEQKRLDEREAEERKERALARKMADARMMLEFGNAGYEPFEAAERRGSSLQGLAPVGAALEGMAPGVGVPGVGRALQFLSGQGAGEARRSLEEPVDVPLSDGSSRRNRL